MTGSLPEGEGAHGGMRRGRGARRALVMDWRRQEVVNVAAHIQAFHEVEVSKNGSVDDDSWTPDDEADCEDRGEVSVLKDDRASPKEREGWDPGSPAAPWKRRGRSPKCLRPPDDSVDGDRQPPSVSPLPMWWLENDPVDSMERL